MDRNAKKHAVFIDIDGTLLGSSSDAFSENLATIQKVRSLGHKVFINTGRSTAYLPERLNTIKNFDGVISGGGAVMRYGDKELSKKLMPKDLIKRFSQFVWKHNLDGFLEGLYNMYCFRDYDEALDEIKGFIKLTKDSFDEFLEKDIPIEKFAIIGEVPEGLEEAMGDDCIVLRFPKYSEVMQKTLGKGKALVEVIKILDIPLQNTVAIGDSMNDYEMMTTAGLSVAMGNASQEVKEIADIITEDVDKAGVSVALKKIFNL